MERKNSNSEQKKEDFYDVLGVTKGATSSEIKVQIIFFFFNCFFLK